MKHFEAWKNMGGISGLAAILTLGSIAPSSGATLQGQDKGNTATWTSVNLQGWSELDYIPVRIYFDSGSMGNQAVKIDFPHFSGNIPSFENLSGFSTFSPNAQFTSAPKLTTDPSGTLTYTLSINIADNNPAEVRFFARIAAGAHLNGGSSLQLKGSAGTLQVHKPAPGSGAPDLAIVTTGPATALPSETVSFLLSYSNKALTNVAIGAQLSQILPPQFAVVTNSLSPNAQVVGNTIFWDLGVLAGQTSGQISFQAQLDPSVSPGTILSSLTQILSSEDDSNPSDNASTVVTTVVCGGATPAIVSSPASVTACLGSSVTFSVAADAASGLTYQWRKDGAALAGATGTSYSIVSVNSTDAGLYDVAVSTACGMVISGAAVLTLNQGLPAVITRRAFLPDGSFSIQFSTGCGGTYSVQYSEDLVTWKTSPQTVSGNGGSAEWTDAGAPATDSMPNTKTARFYRVVEMP
jgi:hypothetical protein